MDGIDILYKRLAKEQDTNSRKTGFGFGFYRWVSSYEIHVDTHWPYYKIRSVFKDLANRGLIDMKQSRSRGMLSYSTKGFDDCVVRGDYFIENDTTL